MTHPSKDLPERWPLEIPVSRSVKTRETSVERTARVPLKDRDKEPYLHLKEGREQEIMREFSLRDQACVWSGSPATRIMLTALPVGTGLQVGREPPRIRATLRL